MKDEEYIRFCEAARLFMFIRTLAFCQDILRKAEARASENNNALACGEKNNG